MYVLCYTLLISKQVLHNIKTLNLSQTLEKEERDVNNKNSKLVML